MTLMTNLSSAIKRCLLYCLILLIIIGCSWQFTSIVQLYLSYPTKIQIDTEFAVSRDALPTLTFCKNIDNKHNGRFTNELFNKSSIIDGIKDVFITKFYQESSITDKDMNPEFILDTTQEKMSMIFHCFILNANGSIVLEQNNGLRLTLKPIDGDDLSHNDTNFDWWIYAHNKMDHTPSYDWNCMVLKKGYIYTLTYNTKTYHLLKAPYGTDCVDYPSTTQFLSRNDCLRKCKIKQSLDRCGLISHEVDVFKGEDNVRFANTTDETNCTESLGLNEYCSQKCSKNDCFKQYIHPMVMEENDWHLKIGRITNLRVLIPFSPKTTFTHRPSVEPVEFVCYMASTLSLWFGFSMISVYFLMKKLFALK